jgi:hypothetical protein
MIIIGCDFHTRYQQIAMADGTTGELLLERRLDHQSGEADAFYRNFHEPVRVGIEATGPIHWFERLPGAVPYGLQGTVFAFENDGQLLRLDAGLVKPHKWSLASRGR